MTPSAAAFLAVATATAQEAGTLIRDRWQGPRQVENKGFRDLVTDADIAAQALITDRIRSAFPDHGFLAEEEDAALPQDGAVTWLVDPIDGTSNYSRQVPVFCVSIAAVESGHVVAGVVYDPMRDELFSARRGAGAWLNKRPVQIAPTPSLSAAVLALDLSRDPQTRDQLFTWLRTIGHQVHTVRAIGSAALALAWVGAGRLDAFVNAGASPWDIAAGGLIVSEAGGLLTDPAGAPWTPAAPVRGCVAGNAVCQPPVLATLRAHLGAQR